MNILFILGNGFDINLGLKTRYQDFYDVYSQSHNDHDSVMKLKDHIGKNTDGYWSDLELALGEYTKEFEGVKDFDEVMDDIRKSLSSYLEKAEDDFSKYDINPENFVYALSSFEEYLIPTDRDKVLEFKEKFKGYHWKTEIVTFNYTSTIERINNSFEGDTIGNHCNPNLKNVLNKNVTHIHGFVNNGMILGVNDLSQVSNTELHDNVDIEESIVKPKYNETCGEKFDLSFIEKIKKSNIICVFGLSFGDSDKVWWERVGERLRQGCLLVIFDRKQDVDRLDKHKLARMRRQIKEHFLKQTGLPDNVKTSINNKIFVGVNTDMFQKIVSKPEKTEVADKFGDAKIDLVDAKAS